MMEKNPCIIEVNDLSATFEERQILHKVAFRAFEQEITVILGASGSGKTTVLKHILGLYNIQEGYISILGKNLSMITESEQKKLYKAIGVFYQNGGLLNSLTIGENLGLPLEQHTDLDDEMIRSIVMLKLNLVNLVNVYDHYPSQLSGGMLKRAALARAMIMDPPLLFCDEPGAGLDPVSLASLDSLLVNLKLQLGISMVIITHQVSSILRIADRIVFLEEGRVIFYGTLSEALDSGDPDVRDFFNKGMRGYDSSKNS
ncbi:MAG: ATP-binding cassette domain-containing protein [Cyclobacteriaceae bacterium]|nr:ATP-binding cassette domain-containing protein [Cyclobacteriaceae bacterium]